MTWQRCNRKMIKITNLIVSSRYPWHSNPTRDGRKLVPSPTDRTTSSTETYQSLMFFLSEFCPFKDALIAYPWYDPDTQSIGTVPVEWSTRGEWYRRRTRLPVIMIHRRKKRGYGNWGVRYWKIWITFCVPLMVLFPYSVSLSSSGAVQSRDCHRR